MNRFDRITAILIHLQSKRIVGAQEIADRFDISLRTVYRDIRSLEEAGVPVIGEKGVGYSIMEGYKLPPVMFTEEEVISFLMAEKVLEQYADFRNSGLFKGAMYKIKAVLRSAEKTKLEEMEQNVSVNPAPDNYLVNDTIPVLLKCISEKKGARIAYAAEDGQTPERDIDPLGLIHEHGGWSVLAWCSLQKDYKPFRTDRILTLTVTGRAFHKKHPPLKDWLDKRTPGPQTVPVVVDVQHFLARYLQEQKYNYGFLREETRGDYVRMYFDAPCIQAFSRWYVTYADQAMIVRPDALKVLLRDRLQTVLKEIS
jgi:predicted DNA-binding transcriptional regulator YafY